MTLRATILGCGSSGGVPRPGGPGGQGQWGACDPGNPKNRRMRCSLLVQQAHPQKGWDTDQLTTILVDTSPDLREQMLLARVTRLDAVLYTHDHADQCHGIDDLRAMALSMMRRIPVFIDADTAGELLSRFAYCFRQPPGSAYPPILDHHEMPPSGAAFAIDGPSGPVTVTPFLQYHGGVDSLGFVFGEGEGRLAYSSDVQDLPSESLSLLQDMQCWILDCLRYKEHPSHAHLDKALGWLKQANTMRGILTNLHVDLDYETLMSETPENVEPAYDGLTVEV